MSATVVTTVPLPSSTDIADISPYSYVPTRWVCIVMIVLFGISTLLHFLTTIRYRLWWLIPTACLAGGGELVGWAGRLWSSINIANTTPFKLQIILTIIAPTPFLASIFIIFTRVMDTLGTEYSRLSPRWYAKIFISCDIIALVIQGLGGGIAASSSTVSGEMRGAHIMLAGIIFQLVAMLVFCFLAIGYTLRFRKDRPVRAKVADSPYLRPWDKQLHLMAVGLALSTGFLLIRAIYRVAELGDGWEGVILRTEVYFDVFDGLMVAFAMLSLGIFNPGVLLYGPTTTRRKVEFVDMREKA
ncbi:hypothetical protein PHLGIDRAFT_129829 [Phlebiopsis gigantea 11061_1 CR5-6]|uniref:RTA1 like protein n=1 Tax=Phlebiopsis gigantea (strain 11061_1 CR5-6) TaxID=745531 RepID=A0A0C3S685_PHLG1|nr:hypothetical protein PHLGIDRAFT_129829 [Phlebiopsis gigantea 11061_1 CR5-6]